MEIVDAIERIDTAGSLTSLSAEMQKIADHYGFASWCFVDAGRAYQAKPAHITSPGNSWNTVYRENGFVEVDPYIAKARRTNLPFDWASLPMEQMRRGPKSARRKLMETAYEFGLKEGLIVPLHFRDPIGRSHSTLFVFHWREKIDEFRAMITSRRTELHLVVLYFMQRAMALLGEEARHEGQLWGFGPAETNALTDRERDVLAWAARGKTSLETSEILAISQTTVEKHISNAIAKLEASNRTHAVAKCIQLGLIDL